MRVQSISTRVQRCVHFNVECMRSVFGYISTEIPNKAPVLGSFECVRRILSEEL